MVHPSPMFSLAVSRSTPWDPRIWRFPGTTVATRCARFPSKMIAAWYVGGPGPRRRDDRDRRWKGRRSVEKFILREAELKEIISPASMIWWAFARWWFQTLALAQAASQVSSRAVLANRLRVCHGFSHLGQFFKGKTSRLGC